MYKDANFNFAMLKVTENFIALSNCYSISLYYLISTCLGKYKMENVVIVSEDNVIIRLDYHP